MHYEPSELRKLFLLRDDIVFLNHGSFGACPRPVLDHYQRLQRELEQQPVEFLSRRLPGLLADARAELAGYLHTSADRLVFVPNTTFGVNIVARSLPLEPGDEVLSTNHEYGAIDRTWRFNCAKRGARYVNHPIPVPVDDPAAIVEHLWAAVTDRTRVIALSHLSSFTALIFPVAEICARARAAGIITVVDGAHAPGQIDLRLDAYGADYYIGNCHKWLCAPKGSAFLWAHPDRQALLEPLVVSWGWQSHSPGPSQFVDYFDWTGTQDPCAYLSVPAAIAFQREYNWSWLRDMCHDRLSELRRRVEELTGMPQISPDSRHWWSQMCCISLPPALGTGLQARLWADYKIEVPILAWQGHLFVRVSIQAYNTDEDTDRLVDALKAVLREGSDVRAAVD